MNSGLIYPEPEWYNDEQEDCLKWSDPEVSEKSIIEMATQVKNLKAEEAVLADAVREITAKKAMRQKQIEWLRAGIIHRMECMGTDKLKTPLHTVSLRQSADVLDVVDQEKLPPQFLKTEVKVLKAELNKHVKATGEAVDGTKWISGGVALSIR